MNKYPIEMNPDQHEIATQTLTEVSSFGTCLDMKRLWLTFSSAALNQWNYRNNGHVIQTLIKDKGNILKCPIGGTSVIKIKHLKHSEDLSTTHTFYKCKI